eukprot:gene14252-14046_t
MAGPGTAGPSNADDLLSEALGYCRQVGAGEPIAKVRARALKAGWQADWTDTTGLHTYEERLDHIEWKLPGPEGAGGPRRIEVDFPDIPDAAAWRAVCVIDVYDRPGRFYRQYLRTRFFAEGLRPAAAALALDRARVEALGYGDPVEWAGGKDWRLQIGQYGDADNAWTGLTYS